VTTPPQRRALEAARFHANLGLPVAPGVRFRLAKRVLYKLSWVFLQHQVAFNHAVVLAMSDNVEEISRRQDEIDQRLSDKLEFGLRQAGREIADHVARTQSELAELQLQMAELTGRLRQPGGGPPAEDAGPGRGEGGE
jgi:uncharacterized coiled-coil protein SlyX